jgi:hypothetical protein
MRVGNFVSWTSTDENGAEFTHQGRVIATNGGRIAAIGAIGVFSFDKGDGTHEKIDALPDFDETVADLEAARLASEKRRANRKPRERSGPTKQDRVTELVREIVAKNDGEMPARKDAIASIVENGITTAAGASTMFAAAKRAILAEAGTDVNEDDGADNAEA